MDDILSGFIDLLSAIAGAIFEFLVWLLTRFLQSGYLIQHTRGLARLGNFLTFAAAGFLLFGILRLGFADLSTPGLSHLYQWPVILGAFGVMLFGLALPEAAREPEAEGTRKERRSLRRDSPLFKVFAFGLAIGLVLMVGSGSASQRHNRTIADRACDEYTARVPQGARETAEGAARLWDRMRNSETPTRLPCGPKAE